MASHFAVVKKLNGIAEIRPLKQWLRENIEYVPEGLDASEHTTYQLRRALVSRYNWLKEEAADKVYLIKPDENGSTAFANELLESGPGSGTDSYEEEVSEAIEVTFGLERDMQLALRSNITQLESGLSIIDGNRERTTEAGRIDITAEDSQGNIVVIEMKAGFANPDVITQILAYMGSIAETAQKPVRGILVAGDFHRKVVWASKAIPNLELKKYTFQFKFEDVS